MVTKVFYNLIEDSMRHGGTISEIRFTAHEKFDQLVIIYEDNGCGITVEDKQRLFQKGFGKNTGLGLFFVKEILNSTGIAIVENGQAGKGVRFEMTVPPGVWRTCSP
ncbi:MAG: HAMP domain-containing sensor histidine kinase [Methanomassiliicoccales archaeon]